MITTRRKLKQQRKLLDAHKKFLKNKKITLQNTFVFTTEKMLQITKEAESINVTKNIWKQPQKRPIQTILENNKNNMPNSKSSSSDSDYEIVAARS